MTTPHASVLPSSRQLLTSLFNAISEIPLANTTPRLDDDSTGIESEDENERRNLSGIVAPPDIDNEAENELNKRRRKLLPSSRKGKGKTAGKDDDQRHQGRGVKTEPGTGNILKQVPLSHRHLIITLHVLFPGLVLPALDLLDRGLVGRIILRKGFIPTNREQERTVKTEDDENTNGKKEKDTPSFYLVRSTQEPASRRRAQRRRHHQRYESGEDEEDDYADTSTNHLFPGGQRAYIVRLEAWNCTCAAFAFASFPHAPPSTSTDQTEDPQRQQEELADDDGQERAVDNALPATIEAVDHQHSAETGGMDLDPPTNTEPNPDTDMGNTTRDDILINQTQEETGDGKDPRDDEEWSFGGLSLDPKGAGSGSGRDCPPLCKHLLACLLAERWTDALGQYVVERQVSKQEMAGIVAEI